MSCKKQHIASNNKYAGAKPSPAALQLKQKLVLWKQHTAWFQVLLVSANAGLVGATQKMFIRHITMMIRDPAVLLSCQAPPSYVYWKSTAACAIKQSI